MRILFLTSEFPYPAQSGGTIKTLSLVQYLQARHQLQVLAFRRGPLTPEQERWAADNKVETVLVNRGRNGWNLARSYLGRLPLSIERNRSAEMDRLVRAHVAALDPEAVFVDGWLMAQYLPSGFAGQKLLHEHNAEYQIWQRQAAAERNRLRRFLLKREYQRVRRYEASVVRRYDTVFAVSPADRNAIRELGVDLQQLQVLPNIPEPELLERPALSFKDTQPLILYFGTLSWQPNIDGLERFLRAIFPRVRRRRKEAQFLIAGQGASPALMRLAAETEGVEFAGSIEDDEALYKRARIFVEATRTGGGTKLKILNALARGLPVVASREAAAGLDIVPGEHLIVGRNDVEMVESIVRLLADEARWKVLSANARALIRARYTAETAFAPLDRILGGAPARR